MGWEEEKNMLLTILWYLLYFIILFSIYYQFNKHVYWYENTTFDSQEWWRRKINKVIRVTERKHPFFVLVHIYMMMSIYVVLPISSMLERMLMVSENADTSRILIILAYHVEFKFIIVQICYCFPVVLFVFVFSNMTESVMLNKNEIQFISPSSCDRYSGIVLCTFVYPLKMIFVTLPCPCRIHTEFLLA